MDDIFSAGTKSLFPRWLWYTPFHTNAFGVHKSVLPCALWQLKSATTCLYFKYSQQSRPSSIMILFDFTWPKFITYILSDLWSFLIHPGKFKKHNLTPVIFINAVASTVHWIRWPPISIEIKLIFTHKNWTLVSIVALLVRTKNRKWPKYPSTCSTSNNGVLLSDTNKHMDTSNNVRGSQKHYAKWKKSNSKVYKPNESIYVTFLKWQSYSDEEQISRCRGLG